MEMKPSDFYTKIKNGPMRRSNSRFDVKLEAMPKQKLDLEPNSKSDLELELEVHLEEEPEVAP